MVLVDVFWNARSQWKKVLLQLVIFASNASVGDVTNMEVSLVSCRVVVESWPVLSLGDATRSSTGGPNISRSLIRITPVTSHLGTVVQWHFGTLSKTDKQYDS